MKVKTSIWVGALAGVVILGAIAIFGMQKLDYLKARYELNKGVDLFTAANYSGAAERFEEAMKYDPELLDARSYRAYAYMMQYIPGGTSEENQRIARMALEGFQEVLDRDPDNRLAMSSIASLYFNMKELDKAKEWYTKLTQSFPDSKEAYYTIGVINWTKTYQPRLEVRAELGMKPEDPGPIKDAKAREQLAERNLPLIDEGLKSLEKAIELDPDYDDAMAYVNLLYRERADIAESKEEYEKYSAIADEWVQKTLDTKKKKAEAGTQDQFQQF